MDNIRKGFIASGYVLVVIGWVLSVVSYQIPLGMSWFWETVYPYDFVGKVVILAGLIVMGLGFLIHRASQKPTEKMAPSLQTADQAENND